MFGRLQAMKDAISKNDNCIKEKRRNKTCDSNLLQFSKAKNIPDYNTNKDIQESRMSPCNEINKVRLRKQELLSQITSKPSAKSTRQSHKSSQASFAIVNKSFSKSRSKSKTKPTRY